MILVAIADGELEEEQAKLLVQAGKVLDVENKHVKEILQV
jgi:tellurite resistance protein